MNENHGSVRVAFRLTEDKFEEFVELCNTIDKSCEQPMGDIIMNAMRLYVKESQREVKDE